MAVENLFETRLEKRYKSLYDKSNDKYGYTGLYKYVLVDPYNNPKADDEIYEIRKKLKKIDFLEDMDFLILSENEKIRKLYKGYLSGLESFQVDCMSYSR